MIRTFSEDIQGTTGKEMVNQECRYKDHTHKTELNARKWVITSEMVTSFQKERKLPDDAVHSHLLISS